MSGLDLQERLVIMAPDLPARIMTGYADVPTAIRAMRNGAFDFIEKPFNGPDTLESIERALAEAKHRRDRRFASRQALSSFERLSAREREIAELVVAGQPTKQIAYRLRLSPKTVEHHRSNIMYKLGADGVVDLVRIYMSAELAGQVAPGATWACVS